MSLNNDNHRTRNLYLPDSKKTGRPPNSVWHYFDKGDERFPGNIYFYTLKIEEMVDLGDSTFNIDQNNNINENQEVSRNESTEYDVEELVSRFSIDCDDM